MTWLNYIPLPWKIIFSLSILWSFFSLALILKLVLEAASYTIDDIHDRY